MKIKNGVLLIGLTAAGLFIGSSAFASDVVVTPANMNGWSFLTTDNNGDPAPGNGNTAQMVTGPATPPLGTGSAHLATAPGQGDSSAQITTTLYNGIALSSLTSLSYNTYVTVNNGQQFPYMKISLSDGNALFFEPPYQTPGAGGPSVVNQGSTVMNQWQSWNALIGGWWDNNGTLGYGGYNGVGTLATYEAANPNLLIEGISLRVGYASPEDNFNGYVDGVTIGTDAGTTTYDFEPNSSSVPDAGATAMLLGIALAGLSVFKRRKITS